MFLKLVAAMQYLDLRPGAESSNAVLEMSGVNHPR